MTSYLILEHPTRGTVQELNSDKQAGAQFSIEGKRSEAMRFPTRVAAVMARRSLSERVAENTVIRRSPKPNESEWKVVV